MLPKLTRQVKKFVAVKPKKTTMKSSPTTIGTIPMFPVRTFSLMRSKKPLVPSSALSGAGVCGATTSAVLTRLSPLWPGCRRLSSGRRR